MREWSRGGVEPVELELARPQVEPEPVETKSKAGRGPGFSGESLRVC